MFKLEKAILFLVSSFSLLNNYLITKKNNILTGAIVGFYLFTLYILFGIFEEIYKSKSKEDDIVEGGYSK